jgi:C-terminal binding protein
MFDKYKPRGCEKMLGTKRVDSMEELFSTSDIVSIHVPLNSETYGLVDEKFINLMKNEASFVNTARGKILKHIDVLYEPLRVGKLT